MLPIQLIMSQERIWDFMNEVHFMPFTVYLVVPAQSVSHSVTNSLRHHGSAWQHPIEETVDLIEYGS